MNRRQLFALWCALLLALPSFAWAQGGVLQYGATQPGHAAKWVGNGAIMDGGPAAGGPVGTGLSELGVTNDTPQAICVNSGPTTAPYTELCMGFNGSTPEITTSGPSAPSYITFNINGTSFNLPGSGSCTGCGTMAYENSNSVSITGGALSGVTVTGSTFAGDTITTPTITGGTVSGTSLTAGTVTPTSGTAARTMANAAGDFKGPAAFLTSGTEAQLTSGTIDATPAVSAALAATGGVTFPCGTYLFNGPITIPTSGAFSMVGQSRGCVVFNVAFTGANLILVGTGSNCLATNCYVDIRNITFNSTVNRTGASVILLNGGFGITLDGLVFTSATGTTRAGDVQIGATNTTRLRNLDFRPGDTAACVFMYQPTETFFDSITMAGCGNGILVSGAAGTYLTDVDIIGSGTAGIYLNPVGNPSSGQYVTAFRGTNVLVDTTQNGPGLVFGGTGVIADVIFDRLWASNTGNTGSSTPTYSGGYQGVLLDNSNTSGVQIHGFTGEVNGGEAISVQMGDHIQIEGAMACANSQYSAGAAAGITVGAGANYVTITDPVSGLCGSSYLFGTFSGGYPRTNMQSYGVLINSVGTQNTYVLTGGTFDNNLYGSVYYDPADLNAIVGQNSTTLTSSTRTITTGTTDTVRNSDYTINFKTSGSVTETLPVCSSTSQFSNGRRLVLRDSSGTAASANDTISAPAGGTTVNGGSSLVISTNRGSFELQCDGIADWGVLASH